MQQSCSGRTLAVRSWLAVHTKASLGDTATALMSLSCADTAAVTTSSRTAAADADSASVFTRPAREVVQRQVCHRTVARRAQGTT